MNEQIITCGVAPAGSNTKTTRPIIVSSAGYQMIVFADPSGDVQYLNSIVWPNGLYTPAGEYFLEVIAAGFTFDGTNLQPVKTNGGNPVINADVTVGVASAVIAAANVARKSLMVQNNGTVDVWLDFDGVATLGAKIKLSPGVVMQWDGESCPSTALAAISGTAAQTVFVMETQ